MAADFGTCVNVGAAVSSGSNKIFPVTMSRLPQNIDDMRSVTEEKLTDPHLTAALTVAALCRYPEDPAASEEMLNWLMGPGELSNYDKSFIKERFSQYPYVPRSYFRGAKPENDYKPEEPFVIEVIENPYSRANEGDGYLTMHIISGGADSPRQVKLRQKKSTGQWFLLEQQVMVQIRTPVSADPWA